MYTNADVTVYLYHKEGTRESYTRRMIESVFWDEVKQSNYLKTGLVNTDSVLIVVPLDSLKEPVAFTPGKDLAVNGIIPFEFDNADAKTLSESLKQLRSRYSPVTVMTVDEKLYGSEGMQHIELSCK